jgi:hypothetical protein
LAIVRLNNSATSPEVETLARALAGHGGDEVRLSHAREVAQAQLDLERVQAAKISLVNLKIAAATSPKAEVQQESNGDAGLSAGEGTSDESEFRELPLVAMIEIVKELALLERYERAALSRCRQAMRAFFTYQPSGTSGDGQG